MTPELWQRVREVLAEALTLKPEGRQAFLDRVCNSDHQLRREVETLLRSSAEVQSSFLQSSESLIAIAPGTKLGDYEVLRLLGSGGMGEVYRARDRRLGRDVAIKVLPALLSRDPDRLWRFEQEARAAAALNHPNILAVFQMGTYEGAPYLVSELLEGSTLRELLSRGSLLIRKTIDHGVQIARGLAAAHDKGIVHRDLKPENLFVTKDARVKILDFGLAKLTQRHSLDDSNAATVTEGTEPGTVMGTVGYMSPEQVSGRKADYRTDIFSFGAILYEMLTGKRAFQKSTSVETMNAILNEDPPAISQIVPAIPPGMQRVVHRCLEKNPEQRFQSASDLAFALEALSDSGSQLSDVNARPVDRNGFMWAIAASLIVAVAAVIAAALWTRNRGGIAVDRSAWVQLTRLPDSANQPSLSPDGRMLTFIRGPNTFIGVGEVYVKILPNGEPLELTHDGSRKMSPVFSPDGSRIAYTVLGPRNTWDTWVVSILGGKSQLWMPNAAALTWIDNQRLIFSEIKQGQHMAIATSMESRLESHDVYVPEGENAMAHRSYVSPDRKRALVVEMNGRGTWMPCRVVPMDGSSNGQAVGPSGSSCTAAAWSPDGEWIYLTADAGDNYHIWRQRFPNGKPEQLTSGPTEEEGVALADDGKSLITAVGLRQRPIWFHDASGDHQVSHEGYAFWPRLNSAGRKLSYRNGPWHQRSAVQSEIWLTDLDSGSVEPILRGFRVSTYDRQEDGSLVFSAWDVEEKPRLWLARFDRRSPPRQIASVDGEWPVFGRNAQIFFSGEEHKNNYLFVVHEDGTGLAKISSDPMSELHSISPDSEWVAGVGPKTGEVGMFEFAYSTSGGPRVPLCNPPCKVGWSPDGKFMFFSISTGWQNMGGSGRTYVLPTRPGTMFPVVPPGGFQSPDQLAAAHPVRIIEAADIDLGPSPDIYAYSREVIQRNLYRIPLR